MDEEDKPALDKPALDKPAESEVAAPKKKRRPKKKPLAVETEPGTGIGVEAGTAPRTKKKKKKKKKPKPVEEGGVAKPRKKRRPKREVDTTTSDQPSHDPQWYWQTVQLQEMENCARLSNDAVPMFASAGDLKRGLRHLEQIKEHVKHIGFPSPNEEPEAARVANLLHKSMDVLQNRFEELKRNAAATIMRDAALDRFVLFRRPETGGFLELNVVSADNERVSVDEIWTGESVRRIVIRGESGVGKSSLLERLSKDWAVEPRLWIHRFDILILIEPQFAATSLEQLLDPENRLDAEQRKAFVQFAELNSHRILWLIDGFDKIKISDASILNVIRAGHCPAIKYLIATMSFSEAATFPNDLLLTIKGLSDPKKFVNKFFNGKPEEYRIVRKEMKSSAWITDLCQNPFFCRLVCIYRNELSQISNRAQLMQLEVESHLGDVPGMRREIQWAAWDSFKNNEFIVHSDFKMEIDILVRHQSDKSAFVWKHSLYQDFLAAEFVCNGHLEDLGTALEVVRWDLKSNSDAFFSFVCGLGGTSFSCLEAWYPKQRIVEHGKVIDSAPLRWIAEDSTNTLSKFLAKHWKNLIAKNGKALLTSAAAQDNYEAIEFLLKFKTIDCSDALCTAAFRGNEELLEAFDVIGMDWNKFSDMDGEVNPLLAAVKASHLDCVRFLTSKRVDLSVRRGNDGATALLMAVENADSQMVKYLLEQGSNVNADCDDGGSTALLVAVTLNHVEIVQILVASGASANLVDASGATSLWCAAANGSVECLKILAENGASVTTTNAAGVSPFQAAHAAKHDDAVEFLLQNGAVNDAVPAPVDNAPKKEKEDAESGAEQKDDDSPLFTAVRNLDLDTVGHLLTRGTAVNVRSKRGETPLIAAANLGDLDVSNLLVKDSDLNAQDSTGRSALFLASAGGHLEVVRLLVSNGADVSLKSKDQSTALYAACFGGHRAVAKCLLVDGKADPNIVILKTKDTPLMAAYRSNNPDLLALLLQQGASASDADVPQGLLAVLAKRPDLADRELLGERKFGLNAAHYAQWLRNDVAKMELAKLGVISADHDQGNAIYRCFLENKCTFESTRVSNPANRPVQPTMTCLTCWPDGKRICWACADRCHPFHSLGPAVLSSGHLCDCPVAPGNKHVQFKKPISTKTGIKGIFRRNK